MLGIVLVFLFVMTVWAVGLAIFLGKKARARGQAMPYELGARGLDVVIREKPVTAVPVSVASPKSLRGTPPPAGQPRLCPQCGDVLAATALGGLCPRCLLQRGLGPAEPEPAPPEGAFTVVHRQAGQIPEAWELAQHFPQLEILELVGQGGMGAVYKARQTKLDRLVAIKVLPWTAGADPTFAERFTREARALARLSHPNIVTVHDFGEINGLYYLVMEFLGGPNLRRLLQQGKLPPEQALQVVPQICDALQYAHEQGVVHRDIKPENILLDRHGHVKIADFGLAKLLGPDPKVFTLTGTQQVMGTPHYMAPEQMDHPLDVDHRADIYSVGVVFYEMLTGELPLGRFAAPSQKAPVDGRFDQVILRALERDPNQRYQHVSEIKTATESLRGAAVPANRVGLNVYATQVEELIGVRTDVNTLALDLLVLAGMAGAMALLGGGIWWIHSANGGGAGAAFLFGVPALTKLGRHIPISSWARIVLGLLFVLGLVALLILAIRLDSGWWWLGLMAGWIAYDDLKSFFEFAIGGSRKHSVAAVEQAAVDDAALASLSPEEQELFRLLKQHRTDYCFYLIPEIPAEALHTARKRSGAPPTERILAYLDLTADEGGKYNLLVGSQGVYFHDADKVTLSMSFDEFPDRVFVNHGKAVYLGKDQYFHPDLDSNDAFDCETIANLLNALRAWVVRRKQAAPAAPPA
jgi:hypothetical protein